MNKVFLTGNIVRDPEARDAGKSVCANFSVASRRGFRNRNGEYESDFFNCTVWNKTAEYVMKYAKKGMKVLIEGTLQTHSYEKDGVRRTATEITVNNIEMLGPRKDAAEPQEQVSEAAQSFPPYTVPAGFTQLDSDSDRLPF